MLRGEEGRGEGEMSKEKMTKMKRREARREDNERIDSGGDGERRGRGRERKEGLVPRWRRASRSSIANQRSQAVLRGC